MRVRQAIASADAVITSIAVGLPATIRYKGKDVSTGIFKSPVSGRVGVALTNIEGDRQADLAVHGGRDKAVYAYPQCHYDYWAQMLGRGPLEASQFGENLTVTGLDESSVVIGDRYRAGSVEMVIAQPRLPCFKLGIRVGDDTFPQRFLMSGRLGFYLRVEQQGEFAAGDTIELLDRPEHGITVRDLWQTVFDRGNARVEASRCLDLLAHIDDGWVRRLRKTIERGRS